MGARYLGWPNRITLCRLLLIGPFVVCLLNLNEPGRAWVRWLSVGIFGLMATSDMLDGYLARRLQDESPLGRFLDPLADKLLITVAVLFLGVRGLEHVEAGVSERLILPNWAVVTAIGKDLIICLGFVVVYLATGRVFIEARRPGKLCTTVQLGMVLAMLLSFDLPPLLDRAPEILWFAATAFAIFATTDYLIVGVRFVSSAGPSGNAPHVGERDRDG